MPATWKPEQDDPPIITAQSGPLAGQRWIVKADMHIGRDPECDIVIADRQVSRFHARLTRNRESVTVEDLGSKNGTYVNGERIEGEHVLEDGDVLQIALIQGFLFFVSDSTIGLDTYALPVATLPGAPRSADAQAGGLVLEAQSRRVWVNGQELTPPLSLQQFRLLDTLQRRKGEVVPRQELIEEIWGEGESIGVTEQAFDALVRRLRERLMQVDPQTSYVLTVRGHGLRLGGDS